MKSQEPETYIVIPRARISEEAFYGLMEEFILREGTDYGHDETTLDDKKKQVLAQYTKKEIQILFSSATGDCTLMRTDQMPMLVPLK